MSVIDFEQYRQQQRRISNQDRISELEDLLMQTVEDYDDDCNVNSSLDFLGYELLFYDPKNVLGLVGRAYAIHRYDLEKSAKYMKGAFAYGPHNEVVIKSFIYLADQHKYNWSLASSERILPAIRFSLEHFADDERMVEITLRLALHFRNFNIDEMIRGVYDNIRVLNSGTAEKYKPVVELSVRQPPKLKLVEEKNDN